MRKGISRGTELTNHRGQPGGFRPRWDGEARLYCDAGACRDAIRTLKATLQEA